jgi:C-terminal processing protease CtpA/Prc
MNNCPMIPIYNLEMIDFDKEMQNKAEGVVGITIDSVKGGYRILETINEGDAYAKGIVRGDIITKVNGKKPKNNIEFSSMIRGKVGTKVKVEILRNKKVLNFILERSTL